MLGKFFLNLIFLTPFLQCELESAYHKISNEDILSIEKILQVLETLRKQELKPERAERINELLRLIKKQNKCDDDFQELQHQVYSYIFFNIRRFCLNF